MKRSEPGSLHRKLAARYSKIWYRQYVRCKLATDPLYDAVFRQLSGNPHEVLDLGCGLGLLAFYLRERGFKSAITGVDYDAPKIAEAQRVALSLGEDSLRFYCGDAGEARPEFQGNVTVLDMLQFLPAQRREELLAQVAQWVAPGGLLVIRSGLRDHSLRFRITRWVDHFAKWTAWMKDAPTSYPTESEFRAILGPCGLEGIFQPLWGRTPFNNYLIVFQRPSGETNPQAE